ncbi:MAG TPA: CvpA family protein [Clostridiaceae bacterium]|nr:CvpA family protein [Clostridiaceae bacterium]
MRHSYGRPKPIAATMNRLPLVLLLLAVALFIVADLLLGFDFNWVDYVIVIIIALFGLKGYIKGLINTIFSLAGYLVGMLAAYLLSPKLTLIAMQKTKLGESIANKLNEVVPAVSLIGNMKITDTQSESALSIADKIPELENAIAENTMLKQLMSVTNAAVETGDLYSETVVTVNDFIAFSILKVIAFIVLFILIKLLVVIIGKLISGVLSSSSILGTANRITGMVTGFAVGILICYIVFVIAIPILGSIHIIKVPETYTESIALSWFNKLIMLRIK